MLLSKSESSGSGARLTLSRRPLMITEDSDLDESTIGGLASSDRRVEKHVKGQQPCLPHLLSYGREGQPDKPSSNDFVANYCGVILEDGRCFITDGKCSSNGGFSHSQSLHAKHRQLRTKGSHQVRGLAAKSLVEVQWCGEGDE